MVCAALSRSVIPNSLRPHGPSRFLCPRDSPGKNTGMGCHALHQGIFSTEGLNPGLPHCRQILYRLSHQGYARTTYLQWPRNTYFHPRSLSGVPSAYSLTPPGMPQKQTDSSGITFPPPPVPNPLLP